MPGALLDMEPVASPSRAPEYGFNVSHQQLAFEVDFPTQTLTGRTEITILPHRKNLDTIRIDARQCIIPQGGIMVNGVKVQSHEYEDRTLALDMRDYVLWGVEQHEQQRERLKVMTDEERADGALEISLPKTVRIKEVDPLSDAAADRAMGASAARYSSVAIDASTLRANTPIMTPRTAVEQSSRYQPLVISIPFSVNRFRDGVHFAGLTEGDTQFPHVYSRHSMDPGTASSIFPCIDDSAMRCTWEVAITCPRTLGDALKKAPQKGHAQKKHHANGTVNGLLPEDDEIPLSDDEKLLEMTVRCSGEQMSEVDDPEDTTKKIVTFVCSNIVAAQHIGFGIGPFEQVDLTEYREDEEGEKIGQGQSLPVFAYCLPGRSHEVRHVCLPMAHAVDWFMLNFGSYPFSDYSILFVDGQVQDTEHTAGLSICSDRLLFPPDIIDPEMDTTRTLVHALASQWIGVSLVANQSADRWLTIGLSYFMAGLFMKSLCGNNDYMFRQKQLSDKLVAEDVNRPSLYQLGPILHLGPFQMDFMKLKAPLVLFILDKRLFKFTSGTSGLVRIISRLITQANIGTASDSVLSTASFRRLCEKVTRYRQTEAFWNQWIMAAGCPKLEIKHKFNKKRLCVEVTITQSQGLAQPVKKLDKESFLRELKEDVHGVYAGNVPAVFTGSITIRIHEADGTPYEHVVDIKTANDTIPIPYNTKYKRLKRSNRQKERLNAGPQGDANGELNEDTVLYSLGDILHSDEDMMEWGMQDWDEDIQAKMATENYEWIRVDADFEWLCEKKLTMPAYMYVSQLQQDRDVVAHQESMLFFQNFKTVHPIAATVLTRTMMDSRYFHGIRTMAAGYLKYHNEAPRWTGLCQLQKATSELFCYPGTMMPRSNDFSDRRSYYVELAIPHSMSNIRDKKGACPREAREFILDQLRFNDNTDNEYSDIFKIASLLRALTNSLIPQKGEESVLDGDMFDEDADPEPAEFQAKAVEELDRHRRMDEWINSYQNILTTTVLDCKMLLMKAKIIKPDKNEFLRYLIDGNLEQVRIKAFEALVGLGFLAEGGILKFLLCCLSTDPSPYLRTHLLEVFMIGLARIAFSEDKPAVPAPVQVEPENGDLLVEHEFNTNSEEKNALIARTTTIEGAMIALKEELQDNHVLRQALWDAIGSDVLGLNEQTDLLDVCLVLYDPVESLTVKLNLPRFWKAKKIGKGRLRFKKTGNFRTKPKEKPQPITILPVTASQPPPPPSRANSSIDLSEAAPSTPAVRLSFGGSGSTAGPAKIVKLQLGLGGMKVATPPVVKPAPTPGPMNPPPKRPLEPDAQTAVQPNKRRLVTKLPISGEKVDEILSKPPKNSGVNPSSSNKKKKKKKPGPDQSSLPKKSSTPKQPLAPISTTTIQLSPAPSAPSSSTLSSSPTQPASSVNGVKAARKPLPGAAPKANPPPPVSTPLPPPRKVLKIKLTKPKPKVSPPPDDPSISQA